MQAAIKLQRGISRTALSSSLAARGNLARAAPLGITSLQTLVQLPAAAVKLQLQRGISSPSRVAISRRLAISNRGRRAMIAPAGITSPTAGVLAHKVRRISRIVVFSSPVALARLALAAPPGMVSLPTLAQPAEAATLHARAGTISAPRRIIVVATARVRS